MATTIDNQSDAPVVVLRNLASDQPRGDLVSAIGRLLPDALCLLMIAVVALAGVAAPTFWPDSWSQFELSLHVFDDFYRVNTVRQFQFDSLYGVSFPPLYPILLAIARQIYDAGIYTGLLLNAGIAVMTLWQFKRLATAIGLAAWVGNVWMLLLLANIDYDEELVSGGTFPLAMLLMTVLVRLFVEADQTQVGTPTWQSDIRRAVTLGIAAGLLCLARFDFLLVAIALGLVTRIAMNGWGNKQMFIYYATLAVVLSPWCWYSLSHFERPFVSDNSRTVLTAERTYVMDYFDVDSPPPTVFNQPVTWAKTLIAKRFPPVIGAALSVTFNYYPVMLLGGILLGLALRESGTSPLFRRDRTLTLLLWFGLALGAQLLAVALTGYRDRRYFIPVACYGTIVAGYVIFRHKLVVEQLPGIRRWAVPALALLTLGCYVRQVDFKPVLQNLPPRFDSRLTGTDAYQSLLDQLNIGSQQPRLLVVSGEIEPFQFGALTGCVTIPAPSNLSSDNVQSLIERYGATHVLDGDNLVATKLVARSMTVATPYPGLYRIMSNAP